MESRVTESFELDITGHLNLFKLKYENKNGVLKDWLVASRRLQPKAMSRDFSADAVVIMALHQATDSVVLIKQYRPSIDGALIEFPAGKIDPGESIKDAAKRELFEETGLTITEFQEMSPPIYSSSGLTDESVCIVQCYCEGELSTAGNEETEEIVPFLVGSNELDDLFAGKFFNEEYKFCGRLWTTFNL